MGGGVHWRSFPVLPGKVDAIRVFANETMGTQLSGFEEAQRRVGSTREIWSLQELPDGHVIVLVWVETEDVTAVFADLAQDDSEWDALVPQSGPGVHGHRLNDATGTGP